MAAGSLIITEAGGLVGNFTGEADYLYQREVVAGNPKIYGQLVQLLSPYTRTGANDEAAPPARPARHEQSPEEALAATEPASGSAATTTQPPTATPARLRKAPTRIRRDEASGGSNEDA